MGEEVSKLSVAEFRYRDFRIKCLTCRRWMRRRPPIGSPYAIRRPAPHAGHCVGCAVKHTASCKEGCPS